MSDPTQTTDIVGGDGKIYRVCRGCGRFFPLINSESDCQNCVPHEKLRSFIVEGVLIEGPEA